MKAIPAIGKQVPVRGWNQSRANSSCRTVGSHAHQTFREWSDWLRHQSLTKG